MVVLCVFSIILISIGALGAHGAENTTLHPDAYRSISELISSRGFIAEEHYVTTTDGYILDAYRVVNPKLNRDIMRKPVMLLAGFLSSADFFVLNDDGGHLEEPMGEYPDNNLAYALAKLPQFDVWLCNNRGVMGSINHTTIPSGDKRLWAFTYDEMAIYDLPAFIFHILRTTGAPDVAYAAHSQGNLIMFALLSDYPAYSKLIKPFIALAPVVFLGNIYPPVRKLGQALGHISADLFKSDFVKPTDLFKDVALCSTKGSCVAPYAGALIGDSHAIPERIPVIAAHPGIASALTLLHFAQVVKSRRFCKFNLGTSDNLKKYGANYPPDYELENIPSDTKIYLMSSLNDKAADPTDVDILRKKLSNIVKVEDDYVVPDETFTHSDFCISKDSGKLINAKVISYLLKYAYD